MPKKCSRSALRNKCDRLWAEIIKLRAGNRCEYCPRTNNLNSHHIFSRSNNSVRHDLNNGVCLCVAHHTFSSQFSAHKAPAEFMAWIEETRGSEWLMELRKKAKSVCKPNYELIAVGLQEIKKQYD